MLFFVTLDLQGASFHLSLHSQAKYLTTFKFLGKYYHYNVLPFGLRTAPYLMQNFLNFLIRYLRKQNLWAWGHIDNILIASPDQHLLKTKLTIFLQKCEACSIKLNFNKSELKPTRTIETLGFIFSSSENALRLSYQSRKLCFRIIDALQNKTLANKSKESFLGYLAFSCTIQGRPFFVLQDIYTSLYYRKAIPKNVFFFLKDWITRTHMGTPLYPIPVGRDIYTDATMSSLAKVQDGNSVAVRVPIQPIYVNEFQALLWATERATPGDRIFCDNKGLVLFSKYLRTTKAPIHMNLLYKLFLNIHLKQLNIQWISTDNNIADLPSRLVNVI